VRQQVPGRHFRSQRRQRDQSDGHFASHVLVQAALLTRDDDLAAHAPHAALHGGAGQRPPCAMARLDKLTGCGARWLNLKAARLIARARKGGGSTAGITPVTRGINVFKAAPSMLFDEQQMMREKTPPYLR